MKRVNNQSTAGDVFTAPIEIAAAAEVDNEQKPSKIAKLQVASDSDDSGDNDEPSTSTPLPSRLGKCEVCARVDARYCCPKCEVKTCSVPCVQIHKHELNCNGIRDRTKFIPLRKMTKIDFMNDYYFLEECTRYVEDRKHDPIKRFTRYNKCLPKHLFRLRTAAHARRIILRFLLPNFTRHKENTTYLDWKQQKLFWRVEWVFGNAGGLLYIDERCDENLPMYTLLDKYLNPESIEPLPQRKALQYYHSAGVNRIKLLLKAEGIKHSGIRFYTLDINKTLRANLERKTIVEFPRIYLSYEQNPCGYETIDSDEDLSAETRAYQESLEALKKKEFLAQKKRTAQNNYTSGAAAAVREAEELKHLLAEKRREERLRKREEFENAPSNYLFTDEQLWEVLSTSSSDNLTEEDTND